MVTSCRDLEIVCKALGLEESPKKSGSLWSGMANGKYVRIVIHKHSQGKDFKSGIFHAYVKELGFKSEQEYADYLRSVK